MLQYSYETLTCSIGDHAAPRAPFHILIALCATPRFLLLLAQWLVHRYPPLMVTPRSNGQSALDTGKTTALSGNGTRTRAAAKLERIKDEVVAPLEEAERAVVGRWVDTELFVGIARTFCW